VPEMDPAWFCALAPVASAKQNKNTVTMQAHLRIRAGRSVMAFSLF
jgi:hypothetical protein